MTGRTEIKYSQLGDQILNSQKVANLTIKILNALIFPFGDGKNKDRILSLFL